MVDQVQIDEDQQQPPRLDISTVEDSARGGGRQPWKDVRQHTVAKSVSGRLCPFPVVRRGAAVAGSGPAVLFRATRGRPHSAPSRLEVFPGF